jgi:hypothetical protein
MIENNFERSIENGCERLLDRFASNFHFINQSDFESRIQNLFNRCKDMLVSSFVGLADGSCINNFLDMKEDRQFQVLSKSLIVGLFSGFILS